MILDQEFCPICGIDFQLYVKKFVDSGWELQWVCERCNLKIDLIQPIDDESVDEVVDEFESDLEELEEYYYLVGEFVRNIGKSSENFSNFVLDAINFHSTAGGTTS